MWGDVGFIKETLCPCCKNHREGGDYVYGVKFIGGIMSIKAMLCFVSIYIYWSLVVECLTRDRRAAGSSLTGVTVLWSLSKTHLS